jgi:hypothetical protein
MKQTDKSADGTSFHDHIFSATVEDLRKALGEPYCEQNDGEDKVNFEWILETEEGEPFTVYDWKEYRPLAEDEVIEWHIGGRSGLTTEKALLEIREALRLYTL